MQFDNKTLEPIFKLMMGEAGSSFTFEVAQKWTQSSFNTTATGEQYKNVLLLY